MPPPTSQGYLIDSKGKRLAPHDGLWNFTIGQRARIGGMEEAMFVAKKGVGETEQDILVVPGRYVQVDPYLIYSILSHTSAPGLIS